VRALLRSEPCPGTFDVPEVDVRRGDLLDEHSLHAAARGVDAAIHCAACMGYWSRQDELQWRTNVEGTAAMLRVADRRGLRMVHVSSVVAVGMRRDRRPLTEEEPWLGRRAVRAMYVASKREAEERACAAARSGVQVLVVNPAAMIGPRADGRPSGGMVAAARAGRLRRLHPGGSSVAHVADVARGCVGALERGTVGERYLLGGVNVSWLELCTPAARSFGSRPPQGTWPAHLGRLLALGAGGLDALRLSRPPWAPELFRLWGWYTYADSTKARRVLDYAPQPLDRVLAEPWD